MRVPVPNRSFHLPPLLEALGTKGRRKKLCEEALAAIGPLFDAMEPSFGDPTERQLAGQMRMELRTLPPGDFVLLSEARLAVRYLTRMANLGSGTEKRADTLTRASSIILQAVLNRLGLTWLPGVFQADLFGPGSGPKGSELGVRAALLYDAKKFGWRRVAKELINQGHLKEDVKDIDSAAKKVQKAARPFLPTHNVPSKNLL